MRSTARGAHVVTIEDPIEFLHRNNLSVITQREVGADTESCAMEILICTPAIRNLIREGKVHQMASVIQASAKYGMQTLDQSLKQLVLNRKVSLEEAIQKAADQEEFNRY